jgi:hypothetical protein
MRLNLEMRLAAAVLSGMTLTVTAAAQEPPGHSSPRQPVLEWHLLGPLSTPTRPPYYRAQLEVDYLAGAGTERSATLAFDAPVVFEGRTYTWRPLHADDAGKGEIVSAFPGASDAAVFYAAAVIDSPGGPALLDLSSVNSQRAWLDGRQVADILNPIREMDSDSVIVPVKFAAGKNLLLLKLSQAAKKPAEFGAAVLTAPTLGQRLLAWLPFALIILVWGAIAVGAERVRADAPDAYAPGRLVSIDALRGFDMFWITGGGLVVMLLARTSGNYALLDQLDHQTWNGFHFWDLIFPLFLFIVGASIPFAFARRLDSGASPRR